MAWVVISVVVLKFNHASVVTVGVLTGLMLMLFAAEDFALAAADRGMRWLWLIFGGLLTAAGVVALIDPVSTFAGFAEILGFVFLFIGIRWIVQAFLERAVSDLWWLTLGSGILMMVLAFWVSGQFFLERAYMLLVFVGIWALMAGIKLHREGLPDPPAGAAFLSRGSRASEAPAPRHQDGESRSAKREMSTNEKAR